MSKDTLGDRMKGYEKLATSMPVLMPGVPALARLDGRSFHSFCRGLLKPFDPRFVDLMREVAKFLLDETGARIVYVQSDEISLVFDEVSHGETAFLFGGRRDKINTALASLASVQFNKLLPSFLPEKADKMPTFDCRVFSVPTREEAVNCLLWRQNDATRNSISGLAQAHFSQKQLDKKNCKEMQEMLWQEKGINWNDLAEHLKRGSFFRRVETHEAFTAEELDLLPEKHNARKNPDLVVVRHRIEEVLMPPLNRVINRVETLFEGAEPVSASS